MTEPKLLTEAEWRDLYGDRRLTLFIETLRERGLIAEEPVDPLLVEAREICATVGDDDDFLDGRWDNGISAKIALAALRRGREIGRAELTRERLGDAIVKVFHEGAKGFGGVTPDNITRLHAALTQQVQP